MRIAILGGGAVTRIFYVPAFRAGVDGLQLVAVVDSSSSALQRLGNLPAQAATKNESFQAYLDKLVPGSIDGIIVALPHHLHEKCVVAALKKGLQVFCEKPLGLSSESVRRMHDASIDAGCQLTVCQPRRSFAAAIVIRDFLKSGWLGTIQSVRWREGQPYAWPAESLSQVLEEHGGSELYDIGAHAFDLLTWWLGELQVTTYSDDSAGGTAAEYNIGLSTATGVPVSVEFSRLYPLANAVEIETERGLISWDLKNHSSISLELIVDDHPRRVTIGEPSGEVQSMLSAVRAQLLEFASNIQHLFQDVAGAQDALKYARIFDACRERQQCKQRTPVPQPSGRAVVTGAGGFIGTRLVEMLDDRGYSVLALARRAQSCVRLARRAVDIKLADICVSSQLDHGLSGGGDVVFHCAVASGSTQVVWQTIVDGTMNVLHAAERHGFKRVVVFSSMLALGDPKTDGFVDDESLPNDSALEYAKAKREMERRCKDFATHSRVEIVILRPTCVFGPFSRDFGAAHLDRQRKGEFFLLDSGQGLANLVYVDNLVEAAILAAKAELQTGSTFIVNEEEWPISWADFFLPQIKRACGDTTKVQDLTTEKLLQLGAEHRRNHSFPTVFRQAVRSHAACAEWVSRNPMFRSWRALRDWRIRKAPHAEPDGPLPRPEASDHVQQHKAQLETSICQLRTFPYDTFFLSFFTTQALFRSDRARKVLQWHPSVDRLTAMNETLAWVERAYPQPRIVEFDE